MKSPPPPPKKKLNFYYENLYFVVKIIISIIVFYSMHINFVQGKDYPSFRTCVWSFWLCVVKYVQLNSISVNEGRTA